MARLLVLVAVLATVGAVHGASLSAKLTETAVLAADLRMHTQASALLTQVPCQTQEPNVCCRASNGGISPCPHVNGICCSTGGFCCPQGYYCSTMKGQVGGGPSCVPKAQQQTFSIQGSGSGCAPKQPCATMEDQWVRPRMVPRRPPQKNNANFEIPLNIAVEQPAVTKTTVEAYNPVTGQSSKVETVSSGLQSQTSTQAAIPPPSPADMGSSSVPVPPSPSSSSMESGSGSANPPPPLGTTTSNAVPDAGAGTKKKTHVSNHVILNIGGKPQN